MTPVLVVCESGFAQPPNLSNGMKDLANLLKTFLDPKLVFYKRWTTNPAKLATAIANIYWKSSKRLHIILCGHSKGGNGVNKTARFLQDRRVPVYAEILSDAFGDQLGKIAIHVPDNVRLVEYFISTDNKIEGSKIMIENPMKTQAIPHTWIDVPHAKMDEYEGFTAAVVAYAKEAQAL